MFEKYLKLVFWYQESILYRRFEKNRQKKQVRILGKIADDFWTQKSPCKHKPYSSSFHTNFNFRNKKICLCNIQWRWFKFEGTIKVVCSVEIGIVSQCITAANINTSHAKSGITRQLFTKLGARPWKVQFVRVEGLVT